jgi:hypothetical protein
LNSVFAAVPFRASPVSKFEICCLTWSFTFTERGTVWQSKWCVSPFVLLAIIIHVFLSNWPRPLSHWRLRNDWRSVPATVRVCGVCGQYVALTPDLE